MRAVVSLGANLGDPRQQIHQAISEIKEICRVISLSTLIETEPIDAPGQPRYFNAIVIIETDLAPLDLLHHLQRIEQNGGRVRTVRNAARTIDLDLISFGELFLDSEELTLPHPRAHLRRFVLEPWLEIEPTAELPGYGSVRELLRTLE